MIYTRHMARCVCVRARLLINIVNATVRGYTEGLYLPDVPTRLSTKFRARVADADRESLDLRRSALRVAHLRAHLAIGGILAAPRIQQGYSSGRSFEWISWVDIPVLMPSFT